jgi:UDP-3-O-[3-hydroxymyristoyl] glucosamine N-acyltransferase
MKSGEIARLLSVDLKGDGDTEIIGVADLGNAASTDLAFTESAEPIVSKAGLLIVPAGFPASASTPIIRTENPKLLFTRAAKLLVGQPAFRPGIHSSSHIAVSAKLGNVFVDANVIVDEHTRIGDDCSIYAGVMIGRHVEIGANTTIHPNCTIYDNSVIGSGCVLNAGVVIGAPGFGYVTDAEGKHHQFPQLGRVVIGDAVELGSNTCVDRGALGDTVIGSGTKIDNQVQVAHNVQIGKNVIIAAQTGISGSTVIEDNCVIGGQVGIGDHAVLRSGAIIGSQAGILPGKIVRPGIWWGTPVQPLAEYKRQNARVKGLDRLAMSLKEIKKTVDKLIGQG